MNVHLKESNEHLFCKYVVGFMNAMKSKYSHIIRLKFWLFLKVYNQTPFKHWFHGIVYHN